MSWRSVKNKGTTSHFTYAFTFTFVGRENGHLGQVANIQVWTTSLISLFN